MLMVHTKQVMLNVANLELATARLFNLLKIEDRASQVLISKR
jgi:hypothetical protein